MARNHVANMVVAGVCSSFVGGVYYFSTQAVQSDEFADLEEEGKVRAHNSGLKATIKPEAASPLEREMTRAPISTMLGLQVLTGDTQKLSRQEAGAEPAAVQAVPVASDALQQSGGKGAASGGNSTPLEMPAKTGARRYYFFGPRGE
jgi:hypothetical protein